MKFKKDEKILLKCLRLFVVSFFLVACGLVQAQVDAQEISEKAAPLLGNEFLVFIVPSSGVIADATFLTLSATKPSSVAKQLAKVLKGAKRKSVSVAVGGPNSRKTAAVIIDAMDINVKRVLSNLHLVFVGVEADSNKVKKAVEKGGGQYFFSQADS